MALVNKGLRKRRRAKSYDIHIHITRRKEDRSHHIDGVVIAKKIQQILDCHTWQLHELCCGVTLTGKYGVLGNIKKVDVTVHLEKKAT